VAGPDSDIVLAWHQALNAGDVERVVALSHADVEVGGPRGSSRGTQALRDWVARAGVRLWPGRVFGRGEVVVVEERAEWHSAGGGEVTGAQEVASVFRVRAGRVASITRHASLDEALQAAGLTHDHARPR
jgi:ketosteroid isomerase-like protein